jgi:hypothetical protein
MTRTTIRLSDAVLADVKKSAADSGRSMTAVIEDALRESLARRSRPSPRGKLRLTTCGGKGKQPGVDLDDTASLLDLMER